MLVIVPTISVLRNQLPPERDDCDGFQGRAVVTLPLLFSNFVIETTLVRLVDLDILCVCSGVRVVVFRAGNVVEIMMFFLFRLRCESACQRSPQRGWGLPTHRRFY